jgi:predicted Fe-S protein YdhL (DUF1289 family)
MTATAGLPGAASNPASPCVGICLMDPATRTCRGCLRTIDEIAGWYDASIPEKQTILGRLAARRREAERR